MDVETVKKMIKKNQAEYSLFLASCKVARNYYKNKTDILLQSKKADNDNNPLRNADNRIPLNFHGLLVNQKASYMYTSPPIFDLGSGNANKALSRFLGDKYAKVCKDLCIEASNCSVGWIHLWNTKGNGLKYAVVPAEQIVPIFSKNLEKELIGVLRTYQDFSDDGEALTVYEYWDDKVCQSYHVRAGGSFDDDFVSNPVFNVVDNTGEAFVTSEFEHGIGEVPFFHFFNNNIDSGDLDNIKPLIDSYCKVISGFVNDLEDIQEVIFVLTDYGGTSLNGFLQDIKKYKVIQLDSDGSDDKSDARMLSIEIPVEARKELMKIMRQCIFEQGQGIDPDPQNFGNSSGVALSFLYSLLELKAGLQETEFKLGFGRFIRCVCRLMGILIKNDTIVQTWTRTSVRNDKEIADICNQSDGILSTETIVEHHPYVDDPAKEMERLEEQQRADEAAQKEISDMFPQSEKKPEELKDKEEGDA